MARTITIKVTADTKQADANLQKFERGFKSAIDSSTGEVGKLRSSLGGLSTALGAIAGIAVFKQISQFAIDLDKSRNAMTALTGSVTAANAKLRELRELAQASPGVTTSFANELFKQLKAIGGIGDQTINNVIKSLGKLNAVFGDIGPDFARNLIQIFNQSFERSDIKEALGRVPIFEQLLEKGFGTKDPDKLRKLKEAGKLTIGGFLEGMTGAINTDPRFKEVQESLGGRLEKGFDNLKVKLAELGEKLLQVLLPALEKIMPILGAILDFLNRLPDGLKAATIGLIALAPAISGVAGAITGLRGAVVALGGFLTTPAGVAALGVLGVGIAATALEDLINNQIPANVRSQLKLPSGPMSSIVPGADTSFTVGGKTFGLGAAKAAAVVNPPGGGRSKKPDARAAEISELRRKISESRAERGQGNVEDLEQILTVINAANLESDKLFRGERLKSQRESRLALTADFERRQELAKEARKNLEKLPPILSDSERFMRGFAQATESVGDAFERFGSNVARAFGNVRDLFQGLKSAVLGFFNDVIGSTLQNLVRSALGPIFGGLGGSLGAGAAGIFGTPPINPVGSGTSAGSGSVPGAAGGLGSIFSGGGFSLGALSKSFGGAAPFLGVGLGSMVGGQSTLGKILGGVGGGIIGTGIGVATGAITSPAISALFANPFTIPIAAGLLVGGIFLGKAAQRRKDEEASGQLLTQALNSIRDLKAAIASDAIDGAQASSIFESQILAQFTQGISGLKTESVRRSRLTNQVADLRKVYNDLIPPEIAAQQQRRQSGQRFSAIDRRLVPQFAGGGIVPGMDRGFDSVRALLRPGEMVLNAHQQAAVRSIAGSGVFQAAGVPGLNSSGRFAAGGIAASGDPEGTIVINLNAVVDSEGIFIKGGSGRNGERLIINHIQRARTRGAEF